MRHESQSFRENILITHRGLSGPAILQISSYWREGECIEIDLLPNLDAGTWLLDHHGEGIDLEKLLGRHLPQRFASAWCRHHANSKPMNHFKTQQLRDIGRALNRWRISFPASEGYAKAEVTLGGVDTREISSKTMEARAVPGLYFIGEVVDVTGWLGGYNFQWAWSLRLRRRTECIATSSGAGAERTRSLRRTASRRHLATSGRRYRDGG